MKFYQHTCVVRKNETIGEPVYTEGRSLRFVGLPIDEKGQVTFTGDLSFDGAFDGQAFFTVNNYNGSAAKIARRVTQNVAPIDNYPKTKFAFIPIETPEIFEGILMMRPILSVKEPEDRQFILILGA